MDTGGTQDPIPVRGPGAAQADRAASSSVAGDSDSARRPRRDRFSRHFTIDAIADNGGPTMTHRAQLRQPGHRRRRHPVSRDRPARRRRGRRTAAATWAPSSSRARRRRPTTSRPTREYLSGPIQDTVETVQCTFTGSDNQTATEDLNYECRAARDRPTEEPEPLAPWDPVPPEVQWVGCTSPWQGLLLEEGMFEFQVRAIDRNDNTDPTPAIHVIRPADEPPDTMIAEKPPLISPTSRAAYRSRLRAPHTAGEPPAHQFVEFECRLDSRDPELWLECFNPAIFTNLTSGEHTIEVRATGGGRAHRPDAGALHLDGRPAAELRRGEHHADRRRRRLGRRGRPDRELPLRDRADGPLGRHRRPDRRAAGAGRRRERPRPLPLRAAHRRAATARWSRPRCACSTRAPRPAAASRPCRSPAR